MKTSDGGSGGNLARDVQEKAQDLILEEIDPVDPEDTKMRKILINSIFTVAAIASLAAVIFLGIALSRDGTAAAADEPSFSIDEVLSYLVPPYSLAIAQSNSSSAQAKALMWLKSDALQNDYDSYRLRQRYALAVLYFATNGQAWKNSTGWLSNASECAWHSQVDIAPLDTEGLNQTCRDGSHFSTLHLFENDLIGKIPTELELLSDLNLMYFVEPGLSIAVHSEL
jgi:hypothetical protein